MFIVKLIIRAVCARDMKVLLRCLLAAAIAGAALMPDRTHAEGGPPDPAKAAAESASKAASAATKAEEAQQKAESAQTKAEDALKKAEAAAKTAKPETDPKLDFSYVLPALGKLFVAAVILESAFAVIFKSQLYQEFFNGRGLTAPILVILSWFVTKAFGLDNLLGGLFWGFTHDATSIRPPEGWSTFLTALTLAGGSAGVNSMLQTFGYRLPPPPPVTKPTEGRAWISVRAVNAFDRPVAAEILLQDSDQPPDPEGPLTGTTGSETFLARLRRLTFPDRFRYPRYGGHTVISGKVYKITARPLDPTLLPKSVIHSFGDRSVIDLTIKCPEQAPPPPAI